MLKFIIGVFVGGIIGFVISAVCSISSSKAGTDDCTETGDNNAAGN